MSDDMDGVDMAIMSKFGTRASATLVGRRERETRPVARSDRQASSNASTKNKQLNLKVTPAFYERVWALAQNARVSMPTLIERAVAAYVEREG